MKKRIIISILAILVMLSGVNVVWADNLTTTRYSGTNRYDTSFEVAKGLYAKTGKFDNAIVAYGENYPDALSGGYLAKVKNAPLLLVNEANEAKVTSYISNYMKSTGTVYLLGGAGVIREEYANQLRGKGFNVRRLSGSNRYKTNLEILKATVKPGEEILVASGKNFPDALSGSSVGKGLLLADDKLSDDQISWIKNNKIKKFYILGGASAVNKTVENQLKNYAPVERLAGSTRYETSLKIAKRFFQGSNTLAVCQGGNFPDGLSGSPIAMNSNAPIVLINDATSHLVGTYAHELGAKYLIVIGGSAVVSNSSVETTAKHTLSAWKVTKEATCTTAGEKTANCSCGHVVKESIPATGHNYGAWKVTKEATCTTAGEKISTCSCGQALKESIPATGHSYGGWVETTPATTTSTGVRSRTCYNCGGTEQQIIDKLPAPDPQDDEGDNTSEDSKYKPVSNISVSTVKNGGIYYKLNGKYYKVEVRTGTGEDSTGHPNTVVSYYANGTYLHEQIVPFITYSDTCTLSPLYTKIG